MPESLIIAIDGPSGVGKSTVSRLTARHLQLAHLDTGALYRAATLAVMEAGVDVEDERGTVNVVQTSTITQSDGVTSLNGIDVSKVIRSEAVTAAVSAVSAHPGVRAVLVESQRVWVHQHGDRAVVEGRDIGSVVFPEADLKIYLTAAPEVRARRRAGEAGGSHETVQEAMERRDRFDSTRDVSPLTVADGALTIDTTSLTIPEVVDLVMAEVSFL